MKRVYSLKNQETIDLIFKEKRSVGNSYFAVYTKDHDLSHFKYAISIGRKYGNAVERNLAKRRIRHILSNYKDIMKNMSFVIVVKPSSQELSFVDIKKKLEGLLIKSKLIEKEDVSNA
ncbi:ribonuclease P protein component [Acholeplasma hippikon]|uniref:Ribonuclease P protein component n=1 Tax=Acholeplasma hippikon TaxID=264636 RepID=A0A449BL26_9MOLU|nr:ribonuclease P protein component [Acholeplasma hippikon]VEU83037.1 ribonuclease P protein component [Acholeplasma hippikon]